MRRRWATIAACVLAGAAVLACPGRAAAKDGEWSFSHARPKWRGLEKKEALFGPRELELLRDDLGLTLEQSAALADLIEAGERTYELEWVVGAETEADISNEPWDDDDEDNAWERRRARIERVQAQVAGELEGARQRVLSDLELLLTDDQRALLPEAMRRYRRRVMLSQGSHLWGEGVDLVAVVGLLDVGEEAMAEIEPMLADYALELDSGLATRMRASRELNAQVRAYFALQREEKKADADDFEKQNERMSDCVRALLGASERIRDTNNRYARQISMFLEGEALETFETMLAQPPEPNRSWVEEPRGMRLLNFALRIGGGAGAFGGWNAEEWSAFDESGMATLSAARQAQPLTGEQREKIEALREAFETEHAKLRVRHGLHRFPELPESWKRIECSMGWVYAERRLDERDDDERWPLQDYYADLSRLSAETASSLREVLTVRQRVLVQAVDY